MKSKKQRKPCARLQRTIDTGLFRKPAVFSKETAGFYATNRSFLIRRTHVLYDRPGRLVWIGKDTTVSVAALSSRAYILQLLTSEGAYVRKLSTYDCAFAAQERPWLRLLLTLNGN